MIKFIESPESGLCPGVKKAVKLAAENTENTYCLGKISHNEGLIKNLTDKGAKFVNSLKELDEILNDLSSEKPTSNQAAQAISDKPTSGKPVKVIIRSHGEAKSVYDYLNSRSVEIIDATCEMVKKIHHIAEEKSKQGFTVVIIGDRLHPEVVGIAGWCGKSIIVDENYDFSLLKEHEKVAVVAQTTFSTSKYVQIIEKINKQQLKTVEIFDTICYTTVARQALAEKIASECDLALVIGSSESSNTIKLFEIAKSKCANTARVNSVEDLKSIRISPDIKIGIISGASTPDELIMEVKGYMSVKATEVSVSDELKAGVEESFVSYKEGKRVKGTVISCDDIGIRLNIGGKYDGIIYAAEAGIDKEYNPADYPAGTEIEAMIVGKKDSDTDCILLSKKKIDLIREGDKVIESIRGGEVFELLATSATKGGLLGKLGTYTVFIPASHIKEKGFPKDLNVFVKKKLRLTVLDIDDNKRKIVASQRTVLGREREERENIFWTHVKPNVIVNGTVKRITNFGAFVSVDNFDCLAHIVDLSWSHIKTVEEVLEKDKSYDFIVLSVDKEKGRVSLGYKQLQPHPYTVALQKHPVGSICKGKVVSIVPFGAFVQIEQGIEGLVHVSEASHGYTKNINEVVKVGDEVDVMVLAIDEASRRVTLSMKACQNQSEADVREESSNSNNTRGKERRQPRESDERKEWSEDTANNPFADLLKGVDVK